MPPFVGQKLVRLHQHLHLLYLLLVLGEAAMTMPVAPLLLVVALAVVLVIPLLHHLGHDSCRPCTFRSSYLHVIVIVAAVKGEADKRGGESARLSRAVKPEKTRLNRTKTVGGSRKRDEYHEKSK